MQRECYHNSAAEAEGYSMMELWIVNGLFGRWLANWFGGRG